MNEYYKLNLRRFDYTPADPKTNVTTSSGLSAEMKTFYDKNLIRLAEANLVYDQFGQKRPIPKNGGKIIEFRKYDKLPKLTTPLTEGVTPDGQSLNVTALTAEVKQYGGYVTLSDMLMLTAIDNNLLEAQRAIASQAARTRDTIIRDILCTPDTGGSDNVQYAEGQVSARTSLTASHVLTVQAIRMAVRTLRRNDAPTIDGYYVAIIHPDIAYDLMSDSKWEEPHKYQDTTEIYNGEIGKLYGVRFVESSEAKIYGAVGASSAIVYATLVLGRDAYGVTEIEGGGLEQIVKQLGSGGTSDPLNQRATVGWKLTQAAKKLIPQYIVRIETSSAFKGATAN